MSRADDIAELFAEAQSYHPEESWGLPLREVWSALQAQEQEFERTLREIRRRDLRNTLKVARYRARNRADGRTKASRWLGLTLGAVRSWRP